MDNSDKKGAPEVDLEAREPTEAHAPEAGAQAAAQAPQARAAAAPRARSGLAIFALVVALAALALAGWQWREVQLRIGNTQEELAKRLRDVENESRDARSLARQAQEAGREVQAKMAQLDARLTESQGQQLALEALYQDLSRNRDEWQLAEIEQVLAIAAQQLQLAGNVRAALLALQMAESRLARSDRPQFMPVRRALARDIERLKALPALDLPGMSQRLDALAGEVDRLPLAFEERIERVAPEPPAGAVAAAQSAAARLGQEIWGELKKLVVVRRVDQPEPPLLSPTQAYFLRENLKLRLLSARLALLSRNEVSYREDMRAAQSWLQRYFDTQTKRTAEALAQLKQLSSASLNLELPTISESLEAVRGYKARRERGS